MRVKVSATGLYTYPDVLIVCGQPEFEGELRDTLLDPKVIIEVLSDSTEKYDRGVRFRHYQQIPAFQEYVLVSQDEPVCERFVRQVDGSWSLAAVVGLTAEFAFATVPVRIPLAAIYAGITLPVPTLR
jgi:Uma2 family endonuclease